MDKKPSHKSIRSSNKNGVTPGGDGDKIKDESIHEEERKSIAAQSEEIAACRLCWDSEFDVDNPLLQIC